MTKEDEAIHKGLMKILDEADFRLKAREVRAFLVIYEWVKQLPTKLTSQPIQKAKRGNK